MSMPKIQEPSDPKCSLTGQNSPLIQLRYMT